MYPRFISLIAFSCTINLAVAATRYVNVNNTSPASPYLTWATASTNIQNAINVANVNDTILVTNGTYQLGQVGNPYFTRIFTTGKMPIIQSVNGPEVTIIKGSTNSGAFLRCAYLTVGSVLSGFTLTTGKANTPLGGGIYCEDPSCIVTNCIITGNNSSQYGGGAFGGTLRNCILSNNVAGTGGATCSNTLFDCTLIANTASSDGAGARGCSLSNCVLVGNISTSNGRGGAAAYSTLKYCTVSNNVALTGGGLFICTADNSLISSNRSTSGNGGGVFSNALNNCTVQLNSAFAGGGAYQSTLTNCLVQNNFASFDGGGAANGTLVNCIIVSNTTPSGGLGGGAYVATLINSLLSANTSGIGAGAYFCTATNCTIVGNIAQPTGSGAGSYNGLLQNSVIYYNQPDDALTSTLINCCTTSLTNNSTGNWITNEPLFVDINADFHLQSSSPCINAGTNPALTNKTDLDGNPRIAGGTVDIGAYEFQSPTSLISYAWLQQYGLPMDGSADYSDGDNDGMNNWQEWIAGTVPDDSLSLLRMNSAIPTNDLSSATISWQSVAGKKYFLQRSADLSTFSAIQSNIIGQASETSYIDTTATNSTAFFYRVGVQ